MVSTTADGLGEINHFLTDILGKLEIFRGFEEHFKPSTSRSWSHLHDARASFYIDVINFVLITAKHYRSSSISILLRLLFFFCVFR